MKFNMKFNMKYCFIALLLIATIIFLCLGNNLYEGLINENEVRENTYKSGNIYSKITDKPHIFHSKLIFLSDNGLVNGKKSKQKL